MTEEREPVTFLGKENSYSSSSGNGPCSLLLTQADRRATAATAAILLSLEPSPTSRIEESGKTKVRPPAQGKSHQAVGKVGGGIRFDLIIVGKSLRDRVIVE